MVSQSVAIDSVVIIVPEERNCVIYEHTTNNIIDAKFGVER